MIPSMLMLVDCSNCRRQLQLPPGTKSIRCALCNAVTLIAYMPPSPYNHAPSRAPPNPAGRKRALIVAVSYRNTKKELEGCINDAKRMKNMLINRFKFPEASILMLSEEDPIAAKHPTKYNMRMAFYWLMQGVQAGDSLVFHYSGHGSQQRNYSGDEVDGYDEILYPMDFETQGFIVDNEINATIVRPLPRGAKLHAIIDACHSGTVLDLPFLCRMDRYGKYVWEDHRPRSGTWKGTSGGEAISFSGCDDHQNSVESQALSKITSTGVMTSSFILAIELGHGTTYGNVLNNMQSTLRNMDSEIDRGNVKNLISKLLTGARTGGLRNLISKLLTGGRAGGLKQEPQLTANEQFDVYTKPFSL